MTDIKGKGLMETFFVESVYDPTVGRGINGAGNGIGDNAGAEGSGDGGPGAGEGGVDSTDTAGKSGEARESSICELQ